MNNEKMIAEKRRFVREENKKFKTGVFVEVTKDQWPTKPISVLPDKVMRSREFFVQIFGGEFPRLTISRTEINKHGDWKDGISWEELQSIKRECGFGESDAVEVFPADKDIVNVANMRHLWIVTPEYSKFFWRKGVD